MSRSIECILRLCWLLVFVGLSSADDRLSGNGPLEPLLAKQKYPAGLTEDELETLSLDDPKLRIAYYFLMKFARGGAKIVDDRTPEMVAALNDLTRRGSAATPLLLDLMAKNQNTSLEHIIPLVISRLDTIPKEPYVEYLRQMTKSRSEEVNATAFEVAVAIFLQYGTPEDVKLCQDLAARRPFLSYSLQHAFESHARSLPKAESPPGPHSAPGQQPQAEMELEQKTTPSVAPVSASSVASPSASVSPTTKIPVLLGTMSLAILAALYWIMRPRKRSD